MIDKNYINKTNDFKNNKKHTISILNQRIGAELGELIDSDTFSVSDFIQKRDGTFQPNTCSISFFANRTDKMGKDLLLDLKDSVLQIPFLDDYSFSDDLFKGWNFKTDLNFKVNSVLITQIVKKGDILRFQDHIDGYQQEFFVGEVVKTPKYSAKNNGIKIEIQLKDMTYSRLKRVAEDDYYFNNYYMSNNASKDKSLMHIIANKIGFPSVEIDDIKDSNNNFLKVPYLTIEKGASLISELALACRAVESRFHMLNDKLLVKNYLGKNNVVYDFNKDNILEEMTVERIDTFEKQVKVTYSKRFSEKRQLVYALVGKGGDENNSNIVIPSKTLTNNKLYRIDFKDSGIVESYEKNYEIEAVNDSTNAKVNLEYEIKITNRGGTIKLLNTNSFDVRLKKFKIFGIPIVSLPKNTVTLPLSNSDSKAYEEKDNKYIQDEVLAKLKANNSYYYNCNDYYRVTFKSNVARWLKPGDVCTLTHIDYIEKGEKIIIESISRSYEGCNITARSFKDFIAWSDDEVEIIETSNIAISEKLT